MIKLFNCLFSCFGCCCKDEDLSRISGPNSDRINEINRVGNSGINSTFAKDFSKAENSPNSGEDLSGILGPDSNRVSQINCLANKGGNTPNARDFSKAENSLNSGEDLSGILGPDSNRVSQINCLANKGVDTPSKDSEKLTNAPMNTYLHLPSFGYGFRRISDASSGNEGESSLKQENNPQQLNENRNCQNLPGQVQENKGDSSVQKKE